MVPSSTTTPVMAPEVSRELRVAVLHGSDIHRHMLYDDDGEIFNKGNNDMWRLLRVANVPKVFSSKMLHITPAYFRHKKFRWGFENFDAVYNSISEADQNPKVLRVARKILDEIDLPVVNPPHRVAGTRRDRVAKSLRGLPGIVMPAAVRLPRPDPDLLVRRIARGELTYPVIIRPAGTHTGVDLVRCDNAAAATKVLSTLRGAVYVTQFVDYGSRDGIYRKYRMFIIGGQPVFRHLIASDRWNIHINEIKRFMVDRKDLFAEEKAIIERGIDACFPGTTALLQRVTEPFGLDYIGVDFSYLPDGRIVIFEINATMNYLPVVAIDPFKVKHMCVPPAIEALRCLIARKINRPVDDIFGDGEERRRLDVTRVFGLRASAD